jgi:hypothetical protein
MSHDVLLKGPEQVNDRPVRLTRFDDEAGNEIAVSDRTTLRASITIPDVEHGHVSANNWEYSRCQIEYA